MSLKLQQWDGEKTRESMAVAQLFTLGIDDCFQSVEQRPALFFKSMGIISRKMFIPELAGYGATKIKTSTSAFTVLCPGAVCAALREVKAGAKDIANVLANSEVDPAVFSGLGESLESVFKKLSEAGFIQEWSIDSSGAFTKDFLTEEEGVVVQISFVPAGGSEQFIWLFCDVDKAAELFKIQLSEEVMFDDLMVASFLDTHPVHCEENETIGVAIEHLEEKRTDFVIMIKDFLPQRLITRNDLEVLKGTAFEAPGQEERFTRMMCLPVSVLNEKQVLATVRLDMKLREALLLFEERKIVAAPVLGAGNRLVGLLSYHDILGNLVRYLAPE